MITCFHESTCDHHAWSAILNAEMGREVGHVDLDMKRELWTMQIGIDDSHQHQGFARRLIRALVRAVESCMTVRPDQLVFIDVDASAGFWDHLGFQVNRYGLDYKGRRTPVGRGYEKSILWRQVAQF